MAFAAFDIASPPNVDAVKAVLGTWAAAAARMMAGLPIGAIEHHPERPPIDTGEAFGLTPGNLTVTVGFGPSFFDERLGLAAATARVAARPADVPQRRHQAGDLRRRPLRAGVLRRPPGGVPRDPQLRPHRSRRRHAAVVAARLRPHVVDERRPGHAAQPDGVQGRHQRHQGRERRRHEPLRVGRRRRRSAVADRRQLPHRSPHPHADRVVGQHLARRAGAGHRAQSHQRRPARRRRASSTPSTSTPPTPRATRSSTSTPTSVSPAPPFTAG